MVSNVNADESATDEQQDEQQDAQRDHVTASFSVAVPGTTAPEEPEQLAGAPSSPHDDVAVAGIDSVPERTVPAPARYLTPDELRWAGEKVEAISTAFASRVVGQARLQETLLIALLTGGHVLLESVPGLAKTTAAQTIAQAVGGRFHRIQCTPDLLPSDIVGTQVYNQHAGTFETQLGPVHANFVLLDEINRSSAKTQSAMLEAMQERQTSIGDKSYALPDPFLVLATQNPIEQEGTYPLPEAQMDRFMLKDVLDYPSPAEEAEVLRRIDSGVFGAPAEPVVSTDDVKRLQGLVSRVYIDPAIVNYIVGIGYVTRHPQDYVEPRLAGYVEFGASPRASIAFTSAARARALVDGRNHVVPDDVKALTHRVLRHRVTLGFEAAADEVAVESVIDAMVAGIRTP
ncbi:MoxR family ATPase [Terrabacter sp. NPDC000476]|uniref:AAA family ATPase n=1 Tax=Terrabacter sp. NPDC000476 TaxID=3154258 RepID=UPI00332CB7F6